MRFNWQIGLTVALVGLMAAIGVAEYWGSGDWALNQSDQATSKDVVPIAPPERPEHTCCKNGFCWIEPTPFAHDVYRLREVDGRMLGVAYLDDVRGPEPLAWDADTGVSCFDPPVPADTDFTSIDTSDNGWLGLGANGNVYEFVEGRLLGYLELRGRNFARISGNSIEEFVARFEGGGGVVVREGQPRTAQKLPDLNATVKMWPNGTILAGLRQRRQREARSGPLEDVPPGQFSCF